MSDNVVAIVTGSATGIGRQIAIDLHRDGWKVVINGYNTVDQGQALCAELGSGCVYVDADVSNTGDAHRLVSAAIENFGSLSLLVNNAGVARPVPHADLDGVSDEFWDLIMAVNLKGPWNTAKAAMPHLKSRRGQIVNVASLAGLGTIGSSIPYAVSKAGVVHLTKLLAKAMGPEVRVNAIAPGLIDTTLTGELVELRERVQASAPARRLGETEDVANAVRALLSLDYVTGAILPVDGGLGLL